MEIGLTYAVSKGQTANIVENFKGVLDQVELAEELGFAHAFVSEHHFLDSGVFPSPLIAMAYLAAKTERIKLGTGVLLLPLHDPVRVAEDSACLDIVSGGRLILGIGQGYRPPEFDGFHRRLEDRRALMREGTELLRRFWTETDVTFEGEMFNYKNVNVTPKPVQDQVPIWVAAKVKRAVQLAAEIGDVWYADPITPLHLIQERQKAWYETLDAVGKGAANGSMAYYREFFVGETAEAAWELGGKGIESEYMGYLAMNHLVTHDGKPIPPDRKDLVPEIVKQRATIGDPDHCVEELTKIKESLDLDHFVLKMKYWGVPAEVTKNSMRLAAEKVLPNIV